MVMMMMMMKIVSKGECPAEMLNKTVFFYVVAGDPPCENAS